LPEMGEVDIVLHEQCSQTSSWIWGKREGKEKGRLKGKIMGRGREGR